MNRIYQKTWLLIIVVFLFSNCKPKTPALPQSSMKMVSLLDSLRGQAYQSGQYPYFTDQLLRKKQRTLQGSPAHLFPSKRLDYILVLILKGENEKAIKEINQFLKATKGTDNITLTNHFFYKALALAWLRKAEFSNCIHHHNGSSCIIPLEGEGIHQNTEGAKNAFQVYQRLMDFDSTDFQSRWFMNIAGMALGKYPNDIHEKHLIPATAFQSETEFPTFKNTATLAGVDLNNHAGGSCVDDFDNDGLLDIFTTSYSLGDPNVFYRNEGNGSFSNSNSAVGLEGFVGGLNAVHADFDNNGSKDIFITRGAWLGINGKFPNSLLMNQDGKYFVDETESSGLLSYYPTGTAAVSDFNLDGHLDIFVGNENTRNYPAPCELFVNKGDGTFENKAAELGLEINGYVKSVVWGDINNDMLPDLFISRYDQSNLLYINRGGTDNDHWIFEERAAAAGVQEPTYSFTSWFFDYDNDGLQDLIVFGYDNRKSYAIAENVAKSYLGLPFEGELPRLYKNNGDETFRDVTNEMGLDKLLYVMGGNFGDLNNDGYPDFYLGTGEFNIWASVPNQMFLNDKGKGFLDVTTAGGFGQIQKGHGVSFADIDNDGDQDIYHQVGGAAESDIYHNMLLQNPGMDNNWITLELQGNTANASAIGSRIEVEIIDEGQRRKIYRWVSTGGSFGANPLRAHIGIGKAEQIEQVRVFWADKSYSKQKFEGVVVNRHYRLEQGAEELVNLERK